MSEAEFKALLKQSPRGWRQTAGAQVGAGQPKKRGGSAKLCSTRPVILQPKEGPNATETRFRREYLELWLAEGRIDHIGEHESITLNLANGCDYTPDWPVWANGRLGFYEIKGSYQWDDAVVKIKVAARVFPHIEIHICKYDKKRWRIQRVKP